MTTLKLLSSTACAVMMLAGLAYLAVVGLRATRAMVTGDRRS